MVSAGTFRHGILPFVGMPAAKKLTFRVSPNVSWGDYEDANLGAKELSQETGFQRDCRRSHHVACDPIDKPPFRCQGDFNGFPLPIQRVVEMTVGLPGPGCLLHTRLPVRA